MADIYKYTGTFRESDGETSTRYTEYQVDIEPVGKTPTATRELTFTAEDPVVIESEDVDSIFAPSIGNSCTIRLLTDEIYWDLYSKGLMDWRVRVYYNTYRVSTGALTLSKIYFDGYLKPMVLTQDYVWKGELELEASGRLQILEEIPYTPIGDSRGLVSMYDVVKHCLSQVPGEFNLFTTYVPTSLNLAQTFVLEANFFDDDDEPMSCREVIDEIMKVIGCTIYPELDRTVGTYTTGYYIRDITADKSYGSLNYTTYRGTPTIDMDEVYSKITIGADIYELEDVTTDLYDGTAHIFNGVKSASEGLQIYSSKSHYAPWHYSDEICNVFLKPYYFADSADRGWSAPCINLRDFSTDTKTETEMAKVDADFLPKQSNNIDWSPRYLRAYPMKQFSYKIQEGFDTSSSIDWKEIIALPTGAVPPNDDVFKYTNPKFTDGSQWALYYKNPDTLCYTPKDGTSYLLLDMKMYVQYNMSWMKLPILEWKFMTNWQFYETEVTAETPKGYGACPLLVCMDGMEGSVLKSDPATRKSTHASYGKGWQFLKGYLRIGDKYWNGTEWTETEATFPICFHLEDVTGSEDEEINMYKWLKIVKNPNVPAYEIGESSGYAIPITEDDSVFGDLEFRISTPMEVTEATSKKASLPTAQYIPFLKDLKFEYKYKNTNSWADDETEDDDIIYQNVVDESYAMEMDELDLKINSWYKGKPMSKSYIFDAEGTPILSPEGIPFEQRLIQNYYYPHYSSPKKILNVSRTGMHNLMTLFKAPTILDSEGNPTYFRLVGRTMHLREDVDDMKLIEQ